MTGLTTSIILLAINVFYYIIAPITVIVLLALILKALKNTTGATKSGAAQTVNAETISAPAQTQSASETDDAELVAVITAAIHAYETAQGNSAASNLVVRSIKQRNRW